MHQHPERRDLLTPDGARRRIHHHKRLTKMPGLHLADRPGAIDRGHQPVLEPDIFRQNRAGQPGIFGIGLGARAAGDRRVGLRAAVRTAGQGSDRRR